MGWSEDERLLVVTDDGTVRSYADLQGDFTPFNIGHGAEDYGVKACKFWSTGLVALLGNNQLVAVTRYDEPRPQALASAPLGEVISWAIIPPEHTSSRSVEVLLALNQTVCVVDAAECEDRGLEAGPFRHIGVSPNGRFIALYTDASKVWVISSDFQERFSEYESKVRTPPKDLQWCGNNAVVLAWEDEIHLVGPNGASSRFDYNSFVHLLPDIDGIRILTNEACDFLQKVPETSVEIYRPGSDSPAAVLLDAIEQLEKKSPKADDNIQLIRPRLDEAVDVCVRAAGQEYSIHRQKQLLKAASFGKSVLDLYNSDDFVDMTEVLRVLNAVRFYEVGLPLSYDQYLRLTPERLAQRLVNRQEYLLALKISEFLHLPVDKIYVHWARQKVSSSTNTDEDSICEAIVRKLNGKRGISFEEVARAAYDEGRGKLATDLLEHEPRAGKQVPLLLSMGEESVALDRAIDAGDADLVLYVLLTLKAKIPPSSFFRTINSRPVATALVESWASDNDRELLKDLYYQDDRRVDGSNLLLSEALNAGEINPATDKLKMAAKLLRDSKELSTQVSSLEDTQKLLRFQEAFEKDLAGERFLGLSVNETLSKLMKLGHTKRAQKVQTEFKLSDKTFSWIRLRTLISRRDWREIEEISKSKRSSIGWEPYFNESLAAGNPKIASLFVPKCTNLEVAERIEMWMKCGMVVKAGEEALKAKDKGALEELRGKAGGQQQIEIERMLNQLSKGR